MRDYIVLAGTRHSGPFVHVSTVEANGAEQAIDKARWEQLVTDAVQPDAADGVWVAVPSRNWTAYTYEEVTTVKRTPALLPNESLAQAEEAVA